MRKLRGSSVGGVGMVDEPNANTQHTALGLMHLKKLFSEYSHPPQPLAEKEKDDKLYNMLPLFCKVMLELQINIMFKSKIESKILNLMNYIFFKGFW
jgi:hypothetical protein